MKKINIKNIVSLMAVLLFTSCNNEECKYVNETACVETEPEGYMVTTMENFGSTTSVGTIYKTTYNSNAPVGADWNNPALGAGQVAKIATPMWNLTDVGQVFGIAIDNSNTIYLASTDVYAYDSGGTTAHGSAGSAGIYKTNVSSPATTTTLTSTLVANTGYTVGTSQIPNSGVGLGNSIGNIAYDKVNKQLFATNLEDGRIYRIDASTGNVKSIYDPFALDTPSNGLAPINERIWGIGVLTQNGTTEVYFARTEATFNSIWSIKLDASGEFLATSTGGLTPKLYSDSSNSKLEIQKIGTQNKISDIEFSCGGKMLMAERGNPHGSSVFEFIKVGTTWTVTNPFFTGQSGKDGAGGVDYGGRETAGSFIKDDIVWASTNWAKPTNISYLVYGVQGMSSSGNSLLTSASTDLYIDANAGGSNNKGGIGDVDIFDSNCPCNN
ncbi:hypothetical protein [Flavobacterium sp.]|uniref:hypothetical protein n=1 Tax=Flavobacterium sp. TaxID=239 RepID=UPI0026349B40|nr:hypothetical protein [Flavobacterium sp.]